jgi:hypothetical protein
LIKTTADELEGLENKQRLWQAELNTQNLVILGSLQEVLADNNLVERISESSSNNQDESDSPQAFSKGQMTPSKMAQQELFDKHLAAVDLIRDTKIRIKELDEMLTNWDLYRQAMCKEFSQERANGGGPTMTECDIALLTKQRELVRDITQAEAELEKAIIDARDLGLGNDVDQESGFFNDPDDGYGESLEVAAAANVDWERIHKWMDHFDDAREEDSSPHWEAAKSVEISDTARLTNVVPNQRERIDRW